MYSLVTRRIPWSLLALVTSPSPRVLGLLSTRSPSTFHPLKVPVTHSLARYHAIRLLQSKVGQSQDENLSSSDPYNLMERFVQTHQRTFATALAEIEAGHKDTHWSWFIFATPPYYQEGVEAGSSINRYYAIRSPAEAQAFLLLPETNGVSLRDNYLTIMKAITKQLQTSRDMRASQLVGYMDIGKLQSSLEFFEQVSRTMEPPDKELNQVCRKTLEIVHESENRIGVLGRWVPNWNVK